MPIQAKVGWRAYVSPVTASYLLDSYSGAGAAYSLRKLRTTYSGSAIRVRRSSDNTELNIGFDANGDLDTNALSAFVGTGNGFVTTWYDQSGSYNLIQTTAANQPSIVLSGAINTQNGKPVLITDGSFMVNNSVSWSSTTNSIFATIKLTSTRGSMAMLSSVGTSNQHFVSRNVNGTGRYYDSGGQEITASALPNGFNLIGIHENTSGVTVFENGANLVTNFAHDTGGTLTGIVVFRRDTADPNYLKNGSGFAELIVYGNSSKLSDNSAISNNINTYYSVYPNPTSVWNLLKAVYSADTTASSSLKTSLVASYNGESNANDSKGTNNGTAVGGLTYGTGKIGNAFNFNGTTSYVSLPNTSGQFNFTGDFSVSAWINVPTYTGGKIIFSNYSLGGIYGYGILFYLASNNVFNLQLHNENTIGQYQTIGGIPTNSWNHLTFVRKVGQSLKVYLNGTLMSGSYTLGNSSIAPSFLGTQVVNLGSFSNGSSLADYRQDAVNVWNKELTQSEITELYNSGNGAQYIGDNFYKPTTNDALNTYNGTAQGGLTYVVGKVGTAFQFNGTNAYVELPNNSLNFTGDFSYSFWVKMSNVVGSSVDSFIENLSLGSTYANGYNFLRETSSWRFDIRSGGGLVIYRYSSGGFTNGQWYHVVLSRTNNNSPKLYINNTLATWNSITPLGTVPTPVTTLNPVYQSNQSCSIGGAIIGFLNGSIDGLSMWNKELTQAEVTELYNSGNGKQYPN